MKRGKNWWGYTRSIGVQAARVGELGGETSYLMTLVSHKDEDEPSLDKVLEQ